MKKIRETARDTLVILKKSNVFLWKSTSKKALPVLFILTLITSQFWVVDTFMWGQMMDTAIGSKKIFSGTIVFQLIMLTIIYLIANLLRTYLGTQARISRNRFDFEFKNTVDRAFGKKSINLSLKDLDDPKVKDAIDNAKSSLMVVLGLLQREWSVIHSVFGLIMTIIILSFFKWWYGPLLVCLLLPKAILNQRGSDRRYRYDRKNRHLMRHANALAQNIGSESAKCQGSENWFLDRLLSITSRHRFGEYLYYAKMERLNFWFNCFDAIVTLFIAASLFISLSKGEISAGQIAVAMGSFRNLHSSIWEIMDNITNCSLDVKRASDFFYFMEKEPSIVKPRNPVYINTSCIPTIEFRNVSFRYEDTLPYVLRNINVVIRPKEHIGIVGNNSAGKSTFIKLLLGLYDPSEGQILVNGIDMKKIDRDLYRGICSVLFQDSTLFMATLKSAVTAGYMGNQNTEEKVLHCLSEVGVDINNTQIFPKGIHTWINRDAQDSIRLSGGQRQKVALARVLFFDPSVIILDEPTASLDPIAEAEIFENYSKTAEGKTTIMISHRFSSLVFAKRILVFNNGSIVCEGSHETLMDACGIYREMYTKQLGLMLREESLTENED